MHVRLNNKMASHFFGIFFVLFILHQSTIIETWSIIFNYNFIHLLKKTFFKYQINGLLNFCTKLNQKWYFSRTLLLTWWAFFWSPQFPVAREYRRPSEIVFGLIASSRLKSFPLSINFCAYILISWRYNNLVTWHFSIITIK